jgi:hypothetical protein
MQLYNAITVNTSEVRASAPGSDNEIENHNDGVASNGITSIEFEENRSNCAEVERGAQRGLSDLICLLL